MWNGILSSKKQDPDVARCVDECRTEIRRRPLKVLFYLLFSHHCIINGLLFAANLTLFQNVYFVTFQWGLNRLVGRGSDTSSLFFSDLVDLHLTSNHLCG